MNQGIRVSSNRTRAVGNSAKPDWTQQSARMCDKHGKAKKPRRKTLRNQVLMSDFKITEGVSVNRVEKIRIHDEKGRAIRETFIGYVDGRRVERNGYAYGYVKDGKTPGRWYYV